MAIDIRDYEKYSGRKGDPNMRRGSALAGAVKQKAARDAARASNTASHAAVAGYWFSWKLRAIMGIIGGLVILISLAF